VSRPARIARGVLRGVVFAVGAASVLGLLDRASWVFELADVFRLQYVVVLAAAAIAALALKRARLAGSAALLAALNLAVLGVPLVPAASAVSGRPQGALRLVVANVEVGNTDYAAVARLVARTDPDVFGVTELTPAMAQQLGRRLPGYRARVTATRDDAYGIGVYSRLPLLSARIARLPADGGPPTAIVRVRVAGRPVTLVVTHVHTPFAGSIHVRQLQALAAARRGLGTRLAVCGDFNSPPWTGPLREFAGDARLRDLYGGRAWSAYSWPTWSSALRVPLDNCFVGGGLVVTAHRDGPGTGSDHRPLVVDLAVGG
jgi:endonuclease/exonuclease/phosphatase (EEP) superfamily protein YafD